MQVVYLEANTGHEILTLQSDDVAGILAASQGQSVSFPMGHFQYEYHTLDYYLVEETLQQELVIYVKML